MNKIVTTILLLTCFFSFSQQKTIDQKVDVLLKQMTLEEKIGQLNQYTGDNTATGPITIKPDKQSEIKAGKIGSLLNILGSEHTRQYQAVSYTHLTLPTIYSV